MTLLLSELGSEMTAAKLLRVGDVVERLGLSASTIYQLVAERKISHRRIGGAIRFDESDIEEFLESTKRGRKSADAWTSKTIPTERSTVRRSKDWF